MTESTHAHPLITRLADVTPAGSATSTYEGDAHGSQSSFYVSRDAPGDGPELHSHPYTETFVIIAGEVRFTVGDEVVDAGPDDVVVVPANTPHGFTNVGSTTMHSVNIHAAATMQQTDLGSHRRADGVLVRRSEFGEGGPHHRS